MAGFIVPQPQSPEGTAEPFSVSLWPESVFIGVHPWLKKKVELQNEPNFLCKSLLLNDKRTKKFLFYDKPNSLPPGINGVLALPEKGR
jgi:hypothetical protein